MNSTAGRTRTRRRSSRRDPAALCTRCGASVRWYPQMGTTQRIAVDPWPDEDKGTVRLRRVSTDRTDHERIAQVLTGDALHEAQADGESLWVNHFADCPPEPTTVPTGSAS